MLEYAEINPTVPPSSGMIVAAVENRAIVRLVQNTNYCHFGADEVFLLFAPISFDASTFEIWGPLLNGGRLVIMPPEVSMRFGDFEL